jgi:hypothetical protein
MTTISLDKIQLEAQQASHAAYLRLSELPKSEITTRMRMLGEYEHQFKLLLNTAYYGSELALECFETVVKNEEIKELYKIFREKMREAKCPEENIIPLRTFMLHANRVMEYAQRCLDIVNSGNLESFKATGRSFGTADFYEFDIQRCLKISHGMA